MLNEILCKTKLDQLCFYLDEECIRVTLFNVLLFLSFRWNIRKMKKTDFLSKIRRKSGNRHKREWP